MIRTAVESFNDKLHSVRWPTAGIDYVNLMHSGLLFCLYGRQCISIEVRRRHRLTVDIDRRVVLKTLTRDPDFLLAVLSRCQRRRKPGVSDDEREGLLRSIAG